MCALAAGETGALGAFPEVSAKLAPVGSAEHPVEPSRDRPLGLMAGERPFELFAQGASRTEQESLDIHTRDAEDLFQLGAATTLDLAHDESGALVERQAAKRPPDVVRCRPLVLRDRVVGMVVECDGLDPRFLAGALVADAVDDPDQPGVG